MMAMNNKELIRQVRKIEYLTDKSKAEILKIPMFTPYSFEDVVHYLLCGYEWEFIMKKSLPPLNTENSIRETITQNNSKAFNFVIENSILIALCATMFFFGLLVGATIM